LSALRVQRILATITFLLIHQQMTYATGTAASTLLLNQPTTVNYPTTAYLSSPGVMVMDPGYWMTNTMLKLSTQWRTFQLVGSTNPVIKGILKNWANSQPKLPYRFLWQYNLTTPGI